MYHPPNIVIREQRRAQKSLSDGKLTRVHLKWRGMKIKKATELPFPRCEIRETNRERVSEWGELQIDNRGRKITGFFLNREHEAREISGGSHRIAPLVGWLVGLLAVVAGVGEAICDRTLI
jgi:hypothetical protein